MAEPQPINEKPSMSLVCSEIEITTELSSANLQIEESASAEDAVCTTLITEVGVEVEIKSQEEPGGCRETFVQAIMSSKVEDELGETTNNLGVPIRKKRNNSDSDIRSSESNKNAKLELENVDDDDALSVMALDDMDSDPGSSSILTVLNDLKAGINKNNDLIASLQTEVGLKLALIEKSLKKTGRIRNTIPMPDTIVVKSETVKNPTSAAKPEIVIKKGGEGSAVVKSETVKKPASARKSETVSKRGDAAMEAQLQREKAKSACLEIEIINLKKENANQHHELNRLKNQVLKLRTQDTEKQSRLDDYAKKYSELKSQLAMPSSSYQTSREFAPRHQQDYFRSRSMGRNYNGGSREYESHESSNQQRRDGRSQGYSKMGYDSNNRRHISRTEGYAGYEKRARQRSWNDGEPRNAESKIEKSSEESHSRHKRK